MFVREEVLLRVSFTAAQASLATLAHSGLLLTASADAYGEGFTGLARVGPLGSVRGMSRLVKVRFVDLVADHDSGRLALRWEAAGPGGGLFPVLDADITLAPRDEQSAMMTVAGVYRPPLGNLGVVLDQAVLHRVAQATIRAFISRVAEAIVQPDTVTGSRKGITGQDRFWRTAAAEAP
jgi:hypothetical protein